MLVEHTFQGRLISSCVPEMRRFSKMFIEKKRKSKATPAKIEYLSDILFSMDGGTGARGGAKGALRLSTPLFH